MTVDSWSVYDNRRSGIGLLFFGILDPNMQRYQQLNMFLFIHVGFAVSGNSNRMTTTIIAAHVEFHAEKRLPVCTECLKKKWYNSTVVVLIVDASLKPSVWLGNWTWTYTFAIAAVSRLLYTTSSECIKLEVFVFVSAFPILQQCPR